MYREIERFSDEDLLSVVLDCTPERALQLLKFGSFRSLYFNMERDDLNISEKEKQKLQALYEINKRKDLEKDEKAVLSSTLAAINYYKNLLWNQRNEVFVILGLDTSNKLIKTYHAKGTLSEAIVYTREILKFILQYDVKNIILGHNHPGGSLSPSQDDISLTNKLKRIVNAIGVQLLDHIIVGLSYDGIEASSFTEQGLL
jgi:DNA repair protein RadC